MEICRLCQGKPKENEFRKLLDPYKCIINNVIPEANLDTPHNPIICNPCSSVIDELNNFKLQCHDAQKKLMDNSTEKNYNLPINQILPNVTAEKICRTCLHPMECDTFTKLKPSSPDAYLESMLSLCLPDLKLNLTDDPIMCEKCFKTLQKFHQLKTTCLDVEEKLKDGENGSADVKDEEMVEKYLEPVPNFHCHLEENVKLEHDIKIEMEEFFEGESQIQIVQPSYICIICHKSFNTCWKLERHKITHTGEKKYQCYNCGTRYSQKFILEKHMMSVHLKMRPFQCDLCPKSFSGKSNLNDHYKTHKGIRPYVCSICGHCFSQNSNLKKHIQSHSGEKHFKCNICNKKFSSKYNVNSHMEVHNGDKPYFCDLCPERFRHSMNLKVHRMVHFGKNPLVCKVCGMKFIHISGLNSHEKTHLGEKPFACPVCHKRFVKESIVQSHMTLHTGEKPFECFLCRKRYADKSKLNYHLKKKCLKGLGMSISVR